MGPKKDQGFQEKRLLVYFREYCDYTGIHGFRYIGESRTLAERIWWVIWLLLSMMFCGMMVYQIFDRYINYPVLITFSMKETRLQQIPFPAVTICPRAKFSVSQFNITAVQDKMNENSHTFEEMEKLAYASSICAFGLWQSVNYTRERFYRFINETRPDIFKICEYQDQEPECGEFFTPVLTEEGVCYSFNILDKADMFRDNVEFLLPNYQSASQMKHWDVEKGYTAFEIDAYPRRALRVGQKNALSVMLRTKKSDIEYECANYQSGYRVNVHFPAVYPDVNENYFTVPLGQSVTGAIIPEMISTSDGVKQFSPKTRDCYFQSEKPLQFFKVYSQTNCLMECKANYTLELCGCVGFHMPKAPGTPICLMEKQSCMKDVEWDTFFAVNNDYSVIEDEMKYSNLSQCDCLPMCTDISYKLELSQNPITYNPRFPGEMYFDGDRWFQTHFSVLTLYFKTNHIETRERNELYSLSDVISNFGGLLGLFTGFSILSAVEIIYFLSLRIWGNIRLFRNWSGPRGEDRDVSKKSPALKFSDICHMC